MTPSYWVNGRDLVENLYERLHNRYDINKHSIRQNLQLFLEHFQQHYFPVEQDIRIRITERLAQLLEVDLRVSGWIGKGLQQARHAFVILASLAQDYESTLLARALMDFWSGCMPTVLQNEKSEYSLEWQRAFQKLQQLGSDRSFGEPTQIGLGALATLPYAARHRGRDIHRWSGWNYRALSAPVTHRRRSPDFRIPRYGDAVIAGTPPLLPPARLLDAAPFEEIETLAWNQRQMAHELLNMKQEIENLRYW
ncbi:hypothetical protein BKA66DRAFT_426618 [Pyrenochaeta sp. MPI-SDFR-AT-0127]|nr:hypothetical protein BKA66DRAFT_426618 [Pyrenochaeta sp. MPI-SDFR-AT-0127]